MISSNPLEISTLVSLVEKKKEDKVSDYKATFLDDQKHWVEIPKDCVAFANLDGGYLLFGVNDDYTINGLADGTIARLTNTELIQQKINKYTGNNVEISTACFSYTNFSLVAWYITSSDCLLVMGKDGTYDLPSGKHKHAFHKGQIWYRRNSGNSLMTGYYLSKRINTSTQGAIRRMMSSFNAISKKPEIVTISNSPSAQAVRMTNDPKSTPVHGASFTITPRTLEEKVAASIAVYKMNSSNHFPVDLLCEALMAKHSNVKVDRPLALHALRESFPTLYWLSKIPANDLSDLFKEAVSAATEVSAQYNTVKMSSIAGKGVFTKTKKSVEKIRKQKMRMVYHKDFREYVQWSSIKSKYPKTSRDYVGFHLELLRDLPLKYKDSIFEKKLLHTEYTMYFINQPNKADNRTR